MKRRRLARRGDGNDADEHEGEETAAASRALGGPSHTHSIQRLDNLTRLNQNLTALANSVACPRLPLLYLLASLCLHLHHHRRQSHPQRGPSIDAPSIQKRDAPSARSSSSKSCALVSHQGNRD